MNSTQSSDREELIRKAMQALRSTGIDTALRERAEVVLRAVGVIQ
jgi:hypothetical protein